MIASSSGRDKEAGLELEPDRAGLSSSLPAKLSHVPDRARIAETFGWLPGIWGAFFLVVAGYFSDGVTNPSAGTETAIFLVSAALGLVLAGYEFRRHGNRTALVKEGDRIAVYRKGRLDLLLEPEEVVTIKAEFAVMIKIGVPLGLAAVLFTALGIDFITRGKAAGDGLLVLSLALALWASLASAARARFRCAHLRLPIKGSRWFEEDMLVPLSRLKQASIDVSDFTKG
jgi:hypothetical protein